MILQLIKSTGQTYDITQAVDKVEWSGSIIGAARSISFGYLNAPYDISIKLPQIASGDYVSLTSGTTENFFGQIFGIERSTDTGTITYNAYDLIKNLTESTGKYNFKNITP